MCLLLKLVAVSHLYNLEGVIKMNDPKTTSVENEKLTEEEQSKVNALAAEIIIDNADYVSTFGSEAQTEIAKFSRDSLGNTRVYETGSESQKLIHEFRNHLTEFKELEAPKGIAGFIANVIGQINWWMRKYEKVTDFIKKVEDKFRKQIMELSVDLKINDKAHEVNIRNRRLLIIHILAGKMALKKAREETLVELKNTANISKASSDIEAANDFSKRCDEFEIKLGRLDSSLAITYIRKPEIDLLRDSQRKSISLFEDLINQAIPLWLDGMRTSINIKHIAQANELASSGQQMTEDLFLSNIKQLGEAAENTVKNTENGFIRTETIIEGTNQLLASLEAVDTACKEAIDNNRKYEKDRALNNQRITDYQAKASA